MILRWSCRQHLNKLCPLPSIESVNQWISESLNHWISESLNQWISESVNHWIIESLNRWKPEVADTSEKLSRWSWSSADINPEVSPEGNPHHVGDLCHNLDMDIWPGVNCVESVCWQTVVSKRAQSEQRLHTREQKMIWRVLHTR